MGRPPAQINRILLGAVSYYLERTLEMDNRSPVDADQADFFLTHLEPSCITDDAAYLLEYSSERSVSWLRHMLSGLDDGAVSEGRSYTEGEIRHYAGVLRGVFWRNLNIVDSILEDRFRQDILAQLLNEVVEKLRSRHLTVSWGDRLLTIDKTRGFFDDPAFAAAFESIRGSVDYDQYNGWDRIAWRLNTLCWAARRALQAGGDFVECGVHKGDMSWVVLNTIGPTWIPRFYLYDSFEGFSTEYSSPEDFPLNPGFLEFANKVYQETSRYEEVRDRFAPYPNVRVIQGFLPDALDVECPERIGFLHIDLNSPRAEIAVLERLFERVVPGGVVVFDDYGWKLFEKQKIAEDEFMAARGYQVLELPTGQGLVVKR